MTTGLSDPIINRSSHDRSFFLQKAVYPLKIAEKSIKNLSFNPSESYLEKYVASLTTFTFLSLSRLIRTCFVDGSPGPLASGTGRVFLTRAEQILSNNSFASPDRWKLVRAFSGTSWHCAWDTISVYTLEGDKIQTTLPQISRFQSLI